MRRSPRELAFRLKQELANLYLLAARPSVRGGQEWPLRGLPHPDVLRERLRGTSFAAEIERLAANTLQHRFPLLGLEIETGPKIRWRRDYVSGRESGMGYFRRIPYLDFARVGDHKLIWELNRHQHLVLLAQAFLFTGREEFREELLRQWESWVAQNPYQRGINWASALEVGFRALSWIWGYHLAGGGLSAEFRRRFLTELYRHGCHLEYNLSLYFSPNTHLLGEAVALHALGALFPSIPRADHWARLGAEVVQSQLARQVLEDGAHFEQSTYYHLYALDFFLLHYVLAGCPAAFRPVLERMGEYLDAVLGPARRLPLIGDDDGGRVFHPYGTPAEYGRATIATAALLLGRQDWFYEPEDAHPQAAWWLDALPDRPAAQRHMGCSRLFPRAGAAIMTSTDAWALVDAGGFGPFRAGHSHSDTLSSVVQSRGREVLIDPGTYTYVGDARWRDWFRGSAAHNTLRVDGQDQSLPCGPFGWAGKPRVEVRQWSSTAASDFLDAVCRYAAAGAISHRRRVLFIKPRLFLIVDEVDGPAGEHSIEQFWHLGMPAVMLTPECFRIGDEARLGISGCAEISLHEGGEHGWRSPVFGRKCPAPVIRATATGPLPVMMGAALVLSDEARPLVVTLRQDPRAPMMILDGEEFYVEPR